MQSMVAVEASLESHRRPAEANLNGTNERYQMRKGPERVLDPCQLPRFCDVEGRIKNKSAAMEEILGDECAGDECIRVLFGIDLIDHVLQDNDGECNGHDGLNAKD